jgi:hypothetical protein
MSETATEEIEGMAKKAQKTTPVRLTDKAIEAAKIASGYTGESMSEYVSRIVAERADEDAERLHAERYGVPRPKSSKSTKSKGEPKP